jgi:S-DNA-T family DNA segregation ATPase FtsK/SpoIIIE
MHIAHTINEEYFLLLHIHDFNRVVEFLQANGPPDYVDEVQRRIDEGDEGEDDFSDESEDEMYPQALEVIRATRRASTSMLQRRFRVGYNSAAPRVEEQEAQRVVGPENGSSPRDILVDLDVP